MAGILNAKHRVIDAIITQEGRRQVADGDLQIKYVTFTDRHTYYQASDSNNVAEDAGDRVYFEATNRHQDQIILETDQEGRLQHFRGGEIEVSGGKILSGSIPTQRLSALTGSQVLESSGKLLENCATNFKEQLIISTNEQFALSQGFDLSSTNVTFKLTNEFPYNTEEDITSASIDDVESLFQDVRLSHLPNFRHLTPINRPDVGSTVGKPLGDYKKINQSPIFTYQDLMNHLKNRESKTVNFSNTSRDNNLIAQFFEFNRDSVEKLAVIDFGEFPDEDPYSPGKRVFFAGKIFNDGYNNTTFVNMFTIVFD